MVNIPKDFREFLQLLNRNNVRYLIVGGYAVAYHGHPRSTGDIDIFIESTKLNAFSILKALDDFGFSELGITKDDLTAEDNIIQLGYPPLRIDILTSIDGLNFQEAWGNRIIEHIDDLSLNIICLNDLLKNKRSTNRKKDEADVEELES